MRFSYNFALVIHGDNKKDYFSFDLLYTLCSLADGLSFSALLMIHYRNFIAHGHPVHLNQPIDDS